MTYTDSPAGTADPAAFSLSAVVFPSGTEVGAMYDQLQSLPGVFGAGHNLHFGYWSDAQDRSTVREAEDRLTDLMTERVPLPQTGRFLDVGCGLGGPTVRYARATGAYVVGVTVSALQVDACRELAAREGLDGHSEFHLADATVALPFDDESFDAAWALESFPHMDRAAALREIGRVLRPGARLALTDLVLPEQATADLAARLDEIRHQWKIAVITRDELLRVLSAHGFDLLELVDIQANTARSADLIAEQLREGFGAEVMDELPNAREIPGTYVMITAVKR